MNKDKIFYLINIIKKLSSVIENETVLLKANKRAKDLGEINKEKLKLSKVYEQEFQLIHKNEKKYSKLFPKEMDLLKSVIDIFRKTLDDHNRAIFAAKTVTERMIKAISEEASKIGRPPTGYSHYAEKQKPSRNASQPITIALNEIV